MIKQISHRGKGKSTSTFNTVKKSDKSDKIQGFWNTWTQNSKESGRPKIDIVFFRP